MCVSSNRSSIIIVAVLRVEQSELCSSVTQQSQLVFRSVIWLAVFCHQVRPKPATSTNVPIAPAPPPPMMAAPQLLQRPVMLATKLSSPLPSAAPIHQVRIVNGQPCSKTGTTPLTGIVITTPVCATPTRLASPAQALNPSPVPIPTPVQPIQISSLTPEPKVRVQSASSSEGQKNRISLQWSFYSDSGSSRDADSIINQTLVV